MIAIGGHDVNVRLIDLCFILHSREEKGIEIREPATESAAFVNVTECVSAIHFRRLNIWAKNFQIFRFL